MSGYLGPYHLTSGTIGQPDARYTVTHTTYSKGTPGKPSPAFSNNITVYSTDNHFFVNYKLYYGSAFNNYITQTIVPTSGSEIYNYGSVVDFTYTINTISGLTDQQSASYNSAFVQFEGGVDAFGSNSSQFGYYYSSGVPTPIYMTCP